MDNFEPISGITPQEAHSQKPLIFQRVEEIKQLEEKLSERGSNSDLRRELSDAKRLLNEDAADLLATATSAATEEKLQLIHDIVPMVRWREVEGDVFFEKKREALDGLLESIPDEDLTEEDLDSLLDLEESVSRLKLFGVRRKVVGAVKQLSPDKASQFLPRLKKEETLAGKERYGSEWTAVLQDWNVEDSLPFVNHLVDETEKNRSIYSYYVIADTIRDWPPESQKEVIREVCARQGLDYLLTNKLTDLIKHWSHEEAQPLLRELISLPIRHTTYADKDLVSLATAMSEWPSEAIIKFLADENNTKRIRDVAQAKSTRAGERSSSDELYDQLLSNFRMGILANRDGEITPEMIGWIKEGFQLARGESDRRYITSIIKKNPTIYSPKLASEMFRGSTAETAVELLVDMNGGEQLEFRSAIADLFMSGWHETQDLRSKMAEDIQEKWSKEDFDELIIELLSRGKENLRKYQASSSGKTKNVINAFKLLQERDMLTNDDIIKSVLKYSIGQPRSNEGQLATELVEKIDKNEDTERLISEAAGEAIAKKFLSPNRDYLDEILDIAETYQLHELSEYQKLLPTYVQSILSVFNLRSTEDVTNFFGREKEYISYLSNNPNESISLETADVQSLDVVPIHLLEAEQAKKEGVQIVNISGEDDYQNLFDVLSENNEAWQDDQTIAGPFRRGAEVFGYKRMFEYADRQGLTRHDALHAFGDVVTMYQASGLSTEAFYGQVMLQVRSDSSIYNTGTAHHEFNSIAQTLNTDFERAREIAVDYPQDDELQELAELLSNPQEVFASWNRLKFASSRMELLERTDLLEQLHELKDASEKQYTYFRTLLMHPSSKVDAQAVLELWQNPERFLDRFASHTPDEIQDRKKPSNYVHIPNLDLTASQMRDSLIEGDLDRLQTFRPMEIHYRIPVVQGQPVMSLVDLASKALGSRRNKVKGLARNPSKLFSKINGALKTDGLTIADFLEGNTEGLSQASADAIRDVVFDEGFGMSVDWQEITAQIHRKSDPVGVLAGNDTANCMPFGDGKTTVYTYNLNTAQFTMQIDRGDGNKRTVAQSVMTKDKDVQTGVPMLYNRLTQEDSDLMNAMPQAVLVEAPAYIAADNIEVTPNWQGGYEQLIEAIYRDFYCEYMERFGQTQGFNTEKMVIGQGYSDAMTHLPSEQNTFVPLAPVSYSDKMGEEVFVLDLENRPLPAFNRDLIASDQQDIEILGERPSGNGVSFLIYEDALSVGYLESKAYADNPSMMHHLHNMENALMGIHINNAGKKRPHMSLKYTDSGGQMRGYMLAYEGRFEEDQYDDWWKDEGERILYITDLASDKEHQMAGGRLINSFIDLYQKNYLDKDDLVPLYMEAREATSFKIIQRQLDRIGKKLGLDFELKELREYSEGHDTMHPIIITPRKL